MTKKITIGVVLVLLIVGGLMVQRWYETKKLIDTITPHVKNTSLRVANAARFETEKGTKITFKELFEKLEGDVTEIDKRVLEVQTISTQGSRATMDPVVAYLKASQEFLRSLTAKYRKQLALSSATNWADDRMQKLRSEKWGYGFEFAAKDAEKALEDIDTAKREYDMSLLEVFISVREVMQAGRKLTDVIADDALIDVDLLEAVAKNNQQEQPKKPESTPEASKAGSYVVQLGAFSNPANVKQIREKLSATGIPSYTEKLKTDQGEKTRVRAGPFPTQEAAEKAGEKLKKMGLNGIVAPR